MDGRSVLERWLDELPEEEIQREMDEWEARMHEANAEYAKRREILDLKRRWRERYGVPSIPPPGPPCMTWVEPLGAPRCFLSARRASAQSVLQVLAAEPSDRTWSTPQIRDALVGRGWMEDDDKSMRSLQSALSRMKAEGRIIRVRHGVYKSAAVAAALTAAALDAASDSPRAGGRA